MSSPTIHGRKCDLNLHIGEQYQPQLEKDVYDNEAVNHVVPHEALTASSPVFKAMLDGHFREARLQFSTNNPPTLELPEDHPEAMATLCDILCDKDELGTGMTFSAIRRVAMLSNKYDCTKHVRPWFRWQVLRKTHSEEVWTGVCGEVQRWLPEDLADSLISAYLLDDAHIFDLLSTVAVKTLPKEFIEEDNICRETLETLMPETFIEALTFANERLLQWLIDKCQSLIQSYLGRQTIDNGMRLADVTDGFTSTPISAMCQVGSQHLAQFMMVLQTFRLLPTADECRTTLYRAINVLSDVAKKPIFRSDRGCRGPHGREADSSERMCVWPWEDNLEAVIKSIEAKLHCICLHCLRVNSGKPEDIMHSPAECLRKIEADEEMSD
ncbi:hypothetical protein LTR10_020098 [Elasticomyces elasticus]|uniref:BTB domain-containing protein n=1 Tax=Exophiala sideris TaxID=1016849 RepID=A0ABR0IX12_9EURO|nr:hypothetical protein LTR10_020098 [Elasticomyces elasticus]KAK5021320.1 hypothetical protein LTS07_011063 [Exophiala sideris]KAK5024268.1 hypothetical protein LTR13_010889 [Exophiala sideris]KAK5049211.1 hypothetical protein LTR69_011086 [Exophiala sideris]KAK5176523.1 hypothetical protein LTR44_010911 [Eurotiomycetes sp. CCFEE 6388]